MKKLHTFILLLLVITSANAQDIEGTWQGVLDIMGQKLNLVFNIEEKDGDLSATLDSPDQNAFGIPVSRIAYSDDKFVLESSVIGAKYEGILINDTIDGTFNQGGLKLPLKMSRNLIQRPQKPQRPYPYASEDVIFINKKANGIKLAGTFTYPPHGKNFPVVILVSGSGPQNRNEELLGHEPFHVLSDYLTQQGIAVLRYDDRGVAKSEGDFKSGTTKDFASDAEAAIEYLKTRKEVDRNRIGIIGHSEGGTIAFMVAAENKDVSFIVSMAGMAQKGEDGLKFQRAMISKAEDIPEAMVEQNEQLIQRVEKVIENTSIEEFKANIDSIIIDLVPSIKGNKAQMQHFTAELLRMASPWMRYFLNYKPTDDIAKVKCPVLAINGEKDLQVNAEINLKIIKETLLSKGNGKVKTIMYPSLNHLFQTCKTGIVQEYYHIEETISPKVMEDIADWIKSL